MAQHKVIDRLAAAQKKGAANLAEKAKAAAEAAAEAARKQRNKAQKAASATPVPTARQNQSRGSYYSPRQYGADSAAMNARAETARKAMEEQAKALEQSQRTMEELRSKAVTAQKRYYDLSGKFVGADAARYEQLLLDEYNEATRLFVEGQSAYQTAYGAYKPYEDAYNRAARELNDYLAAEEREYQAWRGTIRDAESIRAEQQELKQKRAELKRLMQMTQMPSGGYGAISQATGPAQNELRIRELQAYLGEQGEREKLLQEELGWSELLRWEELRKNEDFARESQYDVTVKDEDYHWINDTDMTSLRNAIRYEQDPFAVKHHMTADEIAMYNYLYSSQGAKTAREYLEYLEPELNRRNARQSDEQMQELGKNHPFLSSALRVAMSPVSGVSSAAGIIAGKITGQEIDPNSPWFNVSNQKNALQEAVAGQIEESLGETWGPVGSFIYNTGLSMADMLADTVAGNPAGAMVLIGSRSFSESVIDAKKRGLSDDEALKMGAVSALAEVMTERIGLDEMLHLPKDWEDAGFWKGLARGAGGEAAEEGLTNIVNLAADLTIAGENSEFARSIEQYKAEGKDDAAALEAALTDAGISLGLDMLGGALSGGAFGGYRGWQGKRAADVQQKQEKAPSVSEADSSPIPDGTGEPVETAPVAGTAEENSAAETVSAQTVRENVQKETAAPDNGTKAHDNGTKASDNGTKASDNGTVREGRTVGETVNEDGGNRNGEEAGEHVLPGGPERADAAGAGEQTGSYAEIRERQQTEARSQAEAAAQRRVKAENLEKRGHLKRVSAQDLGLRQGTEVQELLELPRIEWDQELYDTATRLEKETGMTVRTVTGNIGVRLKGGGVGLAKGYIDRVNKTIVLNVSHSQVTAGQIGDHELWHHKMEAVGRISGDRYEVTRLAAKRIQEQYSPEDFDEVLDAYIDGYGDVYDQSNWEEFLNRVYEEIMADAYAGMNAFGVEASKFRSTVDSTMDELGMGRNMWNAAEQEDAPAPGGDQRVYADEDAPPMPEYEDDSQAPEYDWDGWDDSMIDFSFDGEAAHKKQLGFNKNTLEDGIEKTAKMAPVSDLRGNEFKTGKDMVSAVHSYFESFGGKVENEQLGEVVLSKRGIKDDLAHGMGAEKAASFAAVPEVLRSGKVVDYQKNWKGRGYDTATIAAPIRIAGTEYMMGVVLKRSNQMNRFYIHEVATKKEGTSPFMTGAQEMGLPGGEVPSINSILQRIWDVKNGDARFSMDSEGRELSAEQQAFFKDSKVRDENGRLMVMYHGTPSGKHTTFRSGTYFTSNREYADVYQKPGASMLSSKKDASAPKTYEVYLNITKPFDTRNPRERKIFMEEYYRRWGTGAPLSDSGLPDWTDGMDLQEFIEEMGYDYDGLILDEGATGGYGMEVKSRGLSYVTFSSEQVKDVGNRNPTDDPDIRFSLDKPVEETKDLVAVHNLSPAKLLKTLRLGGLPMPSIAITRAKEGYNEFGEISLVFRKDTIDPEMYRSNKVYSGDAWTPVYPRVEYKVSDKVRKRIVKKIDSIVPHDIRVKLGRTMLDEDNLTTELNSNGGDVVEAFGSDDGLKYAFLRDRGAEIDIPMEEEPLDYYKGVSNEAVRYFTGKLRDGLQTIEMYQNMGAREMMADTGLMEAVADVYNQEVLWTMEPGSEEYRDYEKNLDFHADDLTFSEVNRLLSAARKLLSYGVKQTVDTRAARKLIREKVNQAEYEAWLRNLFDGIVEKEGIRNNADYFTRSGNRRSFEALHYENTLENVILAMKGQGEKGVGTFGGGNIFGAATTEYGSVADIKAAAEKRMAQLPESEFEEIKKGFSDRFFELANGLPVNKSFSAVDDAANMLIEAVAKYKTKSGIANYLRRESKGWANYSDQVTEDLMALVRDIRQMPVSYFEAKPQRAVGFDEVAAAIMPSSESLDDAALPQIKAELENWGVPVIEYTYGDNTERAKALNSVEDVRFSIDGSLSREEYERLAAEVAGDQSKRNEEFVKSRLTPEQYKQYKAFAREDRMDQEAEARVRGIERLEEAQAREDMAALRAQQAEDAAAGRRELAAEEKTARDEAREKAGTAREERKRKAQEKREKLRQEARERIRRAAENAPADSVPTIARKELQDKLISLFSVGEGQRGELRREIGQLADRMIAEGTVDERDLRRLIDRLYESGVMLIEPEEVYAVGRNYLKDEHIYIRPEQIREWGDDWLTLRKKAWGLGVYLVTDRRYAGLDVWNAELASYLPGLFDENETDDRTILERILQIAEEGKAEKVSLPEYTKRIAKQEHQSEEALLYNMERQVEEALRTFGEKASLEMRLKNRNARRRAMDREEAAIVRENERTERERLRQDLMDERAYLKEQNEAERDQLRLQRAENDRRNATERRRLAEERAARRRKHQEAVRKKELRELQEKTLKALQWISKNRRKAPEAMQEAFHAVLGNIDLYAISMADEMRWSSKYGATWKDLKQMYNHARTADPNFIPSEDLQRIVDRLDSVQLESMDFDQLRDLYQAAVGLRTEFYNRNNVIGSEEHEIMEELYNACVEEMRTAPKKLKGLLDRFLNLENLTPMNVFEEMGGFNPDGALYKFAQQLEDGERKVRSFKVRSNKILADFMEDNADWIHRADGQGKDGIWIEVEIPQLIGMKVGEVPEFGGTVKVFMTPMQRVHLYLESRNYDNLRHMTGGRTFADRELYSHGKREEAFAKGTTIRMAPETVQLLVKDMSPEEMELAGLLDKYYNDLAATEINKVSNILLGYNKAMGGHYAPIFTNANYTKSEFGKFDGTAEGAGNLKERVKSKNPSYNISALEAFERNMDRTATYVGMAIPVRNWNTLMNWRTSNSSFADEITHSWGKGRLDYIQDLITDLQNPMGEQQDMVTEMSGKLLSNYISSVFGFNPSIVVKQLGSIPMASAYLDWKHFPKGAIGPGKIDRELIGRYTQELAWRTMGYSMPETKQLKDTPNWSQKNKAVGLVFGGDAITAMDGWAASVLWPWAENKVRAEFPGLEVGDAAMIESGQSPFYQKVAELFNDAVSRSQSVSDQMHQGRLRKSKHAAAKAVTMFRSDSAQSYNVLRQRLGELDYYRRQGEGGKVMAETMKKTVGAAATAVLINSIWGTAVDLLVKALKGKLDEEDKEPLQIAEDFFWGVIDSYAGMVITGDILAETVGNWFTGEMRFDQEAPGVEQFNDILQAADKIINAGKKGNLMGAIKIGAETVASYGFGLPTKNVEAYLMGLFSWALPGAKVAYEDLLKAPAKADLKGLEGDALTVRLNHVLKGYGVELEPEVREALAALYEAGYTEAVPSAAPDSVTVDGMELELDGRMKKEYDKTRGGIIEQELPEITGSAFFDQADEKTRKAMVTKLYNYAAEKAKKAVLEDYAIGTTAQAIDEIVRSGGSAADYAVFDAVTVDMAAWQRAEVLQEWGTDEAVTGLMFKHLVSKSWEDEQAELQKVGVDVGQFLELYAMHGQIDSRDLKATEKATEFAYWLDGQRYTDKQKDTIKDQMAYFQMMPADASRYNAATAAGLDREQALELTEGIAELGTDPETVAMYRVAIDQSVSESNQLRMLQSVGLKDSSYDKVAKGYEMGVAPAAWVRVKEVQQQFDANGNGNMTGAEWEAAIEGICSYGIVLPGDNTRFNLTNEQKAVLWQMMVGKNTKSKNNPFDPAAGQRWRELMGYE